MLLLQIVCEIAEENGISWLDYESCDGVETLEERFS